MIKLLFTLCVTLLLASCQGVDSTGFEGSTDDLAESESEPAPLSENGKALSSAIAALLGDSAPATESDDNTSAATEKTIDVIKNGDVQTVTYTNHSHILGYGGTLVVNGALTITTNTPKKTYQGSVEATFIDAVAIKKLNNSEKKITLNGKLNITLDETRGYFLIGGEPANSTTFPFYDWYISDATRTNTGNNISITGDNPGTIKSLNWKRVEKKKKQKNNVEKTFTCSGSMTLVVAGATETCQFSPDCSGCK